MDDNAVLPSNLWEYHIFFRTNLLSFTCLRCHCHDVGEDEFASQLQGRDEHAEHTATLASSSN